MTNVEKDQPGDIEIPLISDNNVEVKLPDSPFRYFVSLDEEKPGFTIVSNVLGTDGTTYLFSTSDLTIIAHSTHKQDLDGKTDVFSITSDRYREWQKVYQRLLDQV